MMTDVQSASFSRPVYDQGHSLGSNRKLPYFVSALYLALFCGFQATLHFVSAKTLKVLKKITKSSAGHLVMQYILHNLEKAILAEKLGLIEVNSFNRFKL